MSGKSAEDFTRVHSRKSTTATNCNVPKSRRPSASPKTAPKFTSRAASRCRTTSKSPVRNKSKRNQSSVSCDPPAKKPKKTLKRPSICRPSTSSKNMRNRAPITAPVCGPSPVPSTIEFVQKEIDKRSKKCEKVVPKKLSTKRPKKFPKSTAKKPQKTVKNRTPTPASTSDCWPSLLSSMIKILGEIVKGSAKCEKVVPKKHSTKRPTAKKPKKTVQSTNKCLPPAPKKKTYNKRAPIHPPPRVCWPTYRPRTIQCVEEEKTLRLQKSTSGKALPKKRLNEKIKNRKQKAFKKTGNRRSKIARKKPTVKRGNGGC